MSKRDIPNIVRSALDPGKALVMLGKLWRRILPRQDGISFGANLAWLEANAVDFAACARELDDNLWAEAEDFGRKLEVRADEILSNLEHKLGGGAYHQLLYFLTRLRRPETVVETGVAAGFSSQAFLSALRRNGHGRLHSSDFPYFRLRDPERYIGVVVEDDLKEHWSLHVKGDAVNLPLIAQDVERVDLLHYDSDKSYSGRAYALKTMAPLLGPDALLIMDDIQDNSWFHDHVGKTRPAAWAVFACGGKYVGLIGKLGAPDGGATQDAATGGASPAGAPPATRCDNAAETDRLEGGR